MKELAHIVCSLFVVTVTAGLIGCGGGGGGGGDAGGAGAESPGAAPQSLMGRSLQLSEDGGGDVRIDFSGAGTEFNEIDTTGQTAAGSGTYVYRASGNNAAVSLVSGAGDGVRTLTLEFQTQNSGRYQLVFPSGAAVTGTFTLSTPTSSPPVDGGTGNNGTPGGNGGSDGGTGGENPGEPVPPGAGGLDGRVISMTRSTGQTHTYTFDGNRFIDSDPPEQGNGTYTFSRSGSLATLVLNYTGSTGPVSLAGDRHELQMTFNTDTGGTYTSTYFANDGTVLPQDGVFKFVQ